MTETSWNLPTKDGFTIYGLLNSHPKKKNNKAIIHVHGLTGWQGEFSATSLAQYMPKHGYDVIRLNLYNWLKGARSLVDCTIDIHAADINAVVKHFQKQYKQLFATGHSYGGPSLMTSKINEFAAVSLWDPSYAIADLWSKRDFIKSGKYYLSTTGSTMILGKAFLEEALAFDRKHAVKLSKKCTAPLQVVFCDRDSIWVHYGESFHTHAKGPTDEKTTKKSQHAFYEEGAMPWLLRQTRQWFDQF